MTKKSRPTIYKYVDEFSKGNYDDIPYSIIKLFRMIGIATKSEIIAYCNANYSIAVTDDNSKQLQELISLIISNQGRLDVSKIKDFVMEELNND